jgi:CBS domain-containing protein
VASPERNVMTAAVAAATPDMPIVEAHRLMRKHGVHHLPVTDADGKVKGIVSSNDLIKALMQIGG